MPVPNLIHPQDVVISRKDAAATIFDRDAREPVREVARMADLTIRAQVSYSPTRAPEYERIGPNEKITGYLLFRHVDLAAKSYTPKRGDRVVSLQGVAANLWIVQIFPTMHYPGLGATCLRAFFGDRRPSAISPDQG